MASQVRRIDVGSVTLEVTEQGEGEPVVLLHGMPGPSYSWRHQLPALAAAGFRAVAPNLRGYGGSDRPSAVEDYALPKFVEDATGLIAALDAGPAHVVGHDWGAVFAWAIGALAPEAVRSVTAINGPHPTAFFEELLDPHDWRQNQMSWYMLLFQFPGVAEEWLAKDDFANLRHFGFGTAAPGTFSDEEIEVVVGQLRGEGALTAALNYYRANVPPALLLAAAPELPPVSVPTMVIWGEEDIYLGTGGLERSLPYAKGRLRVERLPGVSHWVQEEVPDLVNRLLVEFLTEHGSRRAR